LANMFCEIACLVAGIFFVYVIWKFSILDTDWQSFHANIDPTYFDRKVIWITGASSGIGKALATKIASFSDCTFVLTARREDILKEVGKEIQSINKNCEIVVLPMDLSNNDISYYQQNAKKIIDKFPNGVDMIIHSAGYSMRSCAVDFPIKDDLNMFQVDLLSPVILTKLMLPEMTQKNLLKKPKNIVVISSAAGIAWTPIRTTYGSCKAGIAAFHESLRYEVLPYNVSILNVFPGFVATNIDVNSVGREGRHSQQKEEFIQKGLDVNRCAQIVCASISSHLPECWPAKHPLLSVLYFVTYLPWLKSRVMPLVAKKMLKDHGY